MEELILDLEQLQKISEYCEARKYSYTTWHNYMTQLKKIAKKYGKINKEIALKFYRTATNSSHYALITLINSYCLDNDIDFYVKKIKSQKKYERVQEVLSKDEIDKLINNLEMPYSLIVKCFFYIGGGVRVSDIAKLRFENFNFPDWLEDESKQGLVILQKRKRGKESLQSVPNFLMKEIFDYAKAEELIEEDGIPTSGLVFDFGAGDFMPELRQDLSAWTFQYMKHVRNILQYQLIRRFLRKDKNFFGGKKIHLQSFRHSRTTYLSEKGIPVEKIQIIRDDTSITTTMKYIHLNKKNIFNEIENVDKEG